MNLAERFKRFPKNACARQALASNIAWDVLYAHAAEHKFWERVQVMLDQIGEGRVELCESMICNRAHHNVSAAPHYDLMPFKLGKTIWGPFCLFKAPWLAHLYRRYLFFFEQIRETSTAHFSLRCLEAERYQDVPGIACELAKALGGAISKAWLVPNCDTWLLTDRRRHAPWHRPPTKWKMLSEDQLESLNEIKQQIGLLYCQKCGKRVSLFWPYWSINGEVTIEAGCASCFRDPHKAHAHLMEGIVGPYFSKTKFQQSEIREMREAGSPYTKYNYTVVITLEELNNVDK
jgi:hypothetical protein